MSVLAQDLKYALRRLSRTPVFSLFAVAMLGIGIGLNVTVFGLVDALLWRPAPVADPERFVHIYQDSDSGLPTSTAYPAYRDIAAMTDVFDGVAATTSAVVMWDTDDAPQQVGVDFATASYLRVLGLAPSRGRWFDPVHDTIGAERVAVVTDKAWRSRFGADPAVVGRTIRLNNQPVTIIGIGPRGFSGDSGALAADFWLSISSVGVRGPFAVANLDRRQDHWYSVKGRLATGVTLERASVELRALAARHAELYPDIDRGRGISVYAHDDVRLHPQLDGILTGSGIGLFVVAGAVLLLVCSNLANLLLVRGFARAPELAIREALGGDRARVGRPLLLEALLLSAAGGILGLLAAAALQELISSVPLPPANRGLDARVDYRMAAFSVAMALGTGLLFGLLPSWRATKTNVANALRAASRTHSSGGGRGVLRATLVAAQVALSVVLISATALVARSVVNSAQVDPGVDAERIAIVGTNLVQGGVAESQTDVVAQGILERVAALPAVESAALTTRLPLSNGGTSSTVIEGYEPARGTSAVELPVASVSAGYFETMGIPLLDGRAFAAADRRGSPPVVVVNETAARLFFGGDAVGRRVRPQDDPSSWREVVGVVGDVKVLELPEPPTPMLYLAAAQTGTGGFFVVARTAGDPAALLGVLPNAIREVRDSLPVTSNEAFSSHLAGTLEAARATALLMGGFAALALLLAALGIYAAVSFAVERRTHEIGIRVALGASASRLVAMVVSGSVKLALVGVVAGLALAVLAAQGMRGILFGVGPLDVPSLAAGALSLIVAAAVAAYLPALRAVRGGPSAALRAE